MRRVFVAVLAGVLLAGPTLAEVNTDPADPAELSPREMLEQAREARRETREKLKKAASMSVDGRERVEAAGEADALMHSELEAMRNVPRSELLKMRRAPKRHSGLKNPGLSERLAEEWDEGRAERFDAEREAWLAEHQERIERVRGMHESSRLDHAALRERHEAQMAEHREKMERSRAMHAQAMEEHARAMEDLQRTLDERLPKRAARMEELGEE